MNNVLQVASSDHRCGATQSRLGPLVPHVALTDQYRHRRSYDGGDPSLPRSRHSNHDGTYISPYTPLPAMGTYSHDTSDMPLDQNLPENFGRQRPSGSPHQSAPQLDKPPDSNSSGGLDAPLIPSPRKVATFKRLPDDPMAFTTRHANSMKDYENDPFPAFSISSRPSVLGDVSLAQRRYSQVIYQGIRHTSINIPWSGKSGWVECDVDESFDHEYEDDSRGRRGRGRRYLSKAERIEHERHRKEEATVVEIRIGEDETLDSIIWGIMEKERREKKGKGKAAPS